MLDKNQSFIPCKGYCWDQAPLNRAALPDGDCQCLKQFAREKGGVISVFTQLPSGKGNMRTLHLFTLTRTQTMSADLGANSHNILQVSLVRGLSPFSIHI